MSSERGVRIPPVGSRRFSEQGLSAQGQSGPKPRQRCVGDGQQVKIPVLEIDVRVRHSRVRIGKPGGW